MVVVGVVAGIWVMVDVVGVVKIVVEVAIEVGAVAREEEN